MPSINLETLTKGEVRSLSGHDRGLAARELFNLNKLDAGKEEVVVTAPPTLDALTPSFVQGFFAASIHALGREGFFQHYNFDLPKHLMTDVQLGVERVLMRRNIAGGT